MTVLLPRPRSIEFREGTYLRPPGERVVRGGSDARIAKAIARAFGGGEHALALDLQLDRALPPQGYRLSVRPTGVTLVGGDPAGQFYGVQTLAQLAAEHGARLPCVDIEDRPDLPMRGVMLDISRDKVPTMATLRGLIDLLASWKVNQFQLYLEHTFAYRAHPAVWARASPLTASEVIELDAFCAERFVELVPNQNSFGHLERWFEHPAYRGLAETEGGIELPWGEITQHPFTLAPSAEGLAFLDGLYGELLPNFTSRRFNVGCDETYDLGLGRSRERVQAVGRPRVWLDFVRRIHQLAARHGRTLQV